MKNFLRSLLLGMLMCFSVTLSVAQQRTRIIGKVQDKLSKEPIVGANIKIDSLLLRSGEEGVFQFIVPAGHALNLNVSHMGYLTESLRVDATYTDTVNVFLEPKDNLLEEITVSTGYEQLPLERATGSFTKIDHSLFNRQISTDVISRLDGIASGLLFDKRDGTNTSFSIRGVSGISSSNRAPLIILDNFPYEGDISNINPNDI